MDSRPLPITIIGWLFIAAGSTGFLYHLSEFTSHSPFDVELIAILLVRLAAIIAGVFLLRGANWARWLLVIWMAYHIVLSALHSVSQLAMHALIFGTVAYFLFRPPASAYFRGTLTATLASVDKSDIERCLNK